MQRAAGGYWRARSVGPEDRPPFLALQGGLHEDNGGVPQG